MALDTKAVRDRLQAIEVDLENEVDLFFGSLIEPFDDLNGVLESKFLKRFMSEYGKLRTLVCERIQERVNDCREELEQHDEEIQAAFEELVPEEDEGGL